MRRYIIGALLAATLATPCIAEEFVVTMSGASYQPSEISAALGDSIKFVNDGTADHNVFSPTAGFAFDLGKQEPGTEKQFVLRTAGKFDVECVFHSNMQLSLEVQG